MVKQWTDDEITEMLDTVISDLKHQTPERREINNKNIKRDLYYNVIRQLASDRGFLHIEPEYDGSTRRGIYVKGYVRDVWEYLERAYDLIHDRDYEESKLPTYRFTGLLDKFGVDIMEGSVIRADGFGSDIEKRMFYCVEYDEDTQQFTSIIYGDADPLSRYTEIEVIGHCEEYRELYEKEGGSGNISAVLK